jgi:hypothetical protein
MPNTDELIDELTTDLRPRRRVLPWVGRGLLAAIALLTFAVLVALLGMRPDFATGQPHSVPLISALVILSAGGTVGTALTAMARPAVGAARSGWQWALAALAVLPIAAIVTAVGNAPDRALMMPPEGPPCLVIGTIASIGSIVALTWCRGAPTSAARASWLVGITGGAVGAVAMGLVCPIDAITHIGTWHVGIIVVAAVGSRFALPRFLRW